jgi:WD40 repeat protein
MTANAAGSRLLVVDDRGRARVQLVANGHTVRVLPTRHVTAATFGPRGPVVVGAPVRAIAFSADGRTSATARGNEVTVRDAGGRTHSFHADAKVDAVALDPHGRLVAAGMARGTTKVWEVDTARLLHVLGGHKRAVTDVQFSPDGARLLTTGLDRFPRISSVETGQTLHSLRWHFGPVPAATFSRDARWIATAGPGTAGLGAATSGQKLMLLGGPSRPLTGVAFAGRNGNVIVTASKDGTIRAYVCQVCGGVVALEALAQRRLAGAGG